MKILVICLLIASALTSGFVSVSREASKKSALVKTASLETITTGLSSVSVSDSRVGEFLEHRLEGLRQGNMLYQGFIALHLGGDSVLVIHSPYGRTVDGKNPGDSSNLKQISRDFFADDILTRSTQVYSSEGRQNRMLIHQQVEALPNGTNAVGVRFVIELIRQGNDSVFSNVRFMMGYDGDIGSTTGGFADDSCGALDTSSNPLVYVFDDSLRLFTGIRVLRASSPLAIANKSLWHQTINGDGKTGRDADSLALNIMTSPTFTPNLGNTDVSLFVIMNIGDVVVRDTLRDTLDLSFVNGVSLADISGLPKTVLLPQEEKQDKQSNLDFIVLPNYPNPFNPETQVRLQVMQRQRFAVAIFNVLGQKIRVLHEGALEHGIHKIYWDGRNDNGVSVSSGVYILTVRGERTVKTSKMLLIH